MEAFVYVYNYWQAASGGGGRQPASAGRDDGRSSRARLAAKHSYMGMTACRLTAVAVGDDKRVLGEMTGDLLVQDELRPGDATLVLTDSDGEELERSTAKPGEAFPDGLALDISQELKVHSARFVWPAVLAVLISQFSAQVSAQISSQ